jgi:hypothetical protein
VLQRAIRPEPAANADLEEIARFDPGFGRARAARCEMPQDQRADAGRPILSGLL